MPDSMTIYNSCAWFNIILASILLVRKTMCGAALIWGSITILWITQLTAFFTTAGFMSLSGVAPTFGIGALVICLFQGRKMKKDYSPALVRPRINACFIILFACSSMALENKYHNTFMMDYIFAKLFFLSRPLSLGLTCFALAGAINLFFKTEQTTGSVVLKESRMAAFLAALIYLGGEISGCYWGFMGWGTTWRWSGNFFFSAMIFVLYMLALHVPRSVFSSPRRWNTGFSIPLAIIVITMTLSRVMH